MTEDGVAGARHPLPRFEFKVGMRFWVNERDGRPQYAREMALAKRQGWMERAKKELRQSNPRKYQQQLGTSAAASIGRYVFSV